MILKLPDKKKIDGDGYRQIGSRLRLYDVSDFLPRHKSRIAKVRDVSKVDTIFVHHSGRLGADGFRGVYNSARYVTTHRNFPVMPYHIWLPALCIDEDGFDVAFQCIPFSIRGWHTGGYANERGIGVAIQGNTTRRPMTAQQVCSLSATLFWLCKEFKIDKSNVSMHEEGEKFGGRNKPACPGEHASLFVKAWREGF